MKAQKGIWKQLDNITKNGYINLRSICGHKAEMNFIKKRYPNI